jgi:spermidine synthase
VRRPRLVLAIFLLSGVAGLVYEVVWSRQLVLVFGNTTQAISTILTGFFGGMAIGSYAGGRVADRVRSPLRLYGSIELVLVAVVLATPVTFRLLHEVYRGAYPSLEGDPGLVALLRFGLAVLALFPATILMGATLPALTRYLGRGAHLSGAFGRLYGANTLGAVVGTLVAGLVLIELLGLTDTLIVGATCSAIAGLAALWLSRMKSADTQSADSRDTQSADSRKGPAALPVVPESTPTEASTARPVLALVLAFVSGLTSLGYQVLWTRLLSSGTGNSTYVFTLILATFLFGIALGAVVFATVRHQVGRPVGLIALAQVLVGALAIAGLVLVIGRPTPHALQAFASVSSVIRPILLVVLPATLIMGFTFPASSALLGDDQRRLATSAGLLLAANTVGAIVATFAIPFIVIPLVGSPHAVVLLALINVATALVLVIVAGGMSPVLRLVGAAGSVAVVVAVIVGLLSPRAFIDPSAASLLQTPGRALYASAEDEIASVQAGAIGSRLGLWVAGTSMTALSVDARLMPVLPLIIRPESRTALTVAFGMGSAFRTALIAGLTTDAVELVPSVPGMFGYFYSDATSVLANRDGHVMIADGRNYMELTSKRYDIIVTDPPPPIESSGVSVISSLEYYEAGHARLNPGGVMMQWLPYGSTVEEFKAHLRTFHAAFPHVTIAFGPAGKGFYLLGSDEPMELTSQAVRLALDRPGLVEDLSSAYDSPQHALDGWARLIPSLVWLSDGELSRFTGDGPLITDDHPLPEYFLLRRIFERLPKVTRGELRQLSGR